LLDNILHQNFQGAINIPIFAEKFRV